LRKSRECALFAAPSITLRAVRSSAAMSSQTLKLMKGEDRVKEKDLVSLGFFWKCDRKATRAGALLREDSADDCAPSAAAPPTPTAGLVTAAPASGSAGSSACPWPLDCAAAASGAPRAAASKNRRTAFFFASGTRPTRFLMSLLSRASRSFDAGRAEGLLGAVSREELVPLGGRQAYLLGPRLELGREAAATAAAAADGELGQGSVGAGLVALVHAFSEDLSVRFLGCGC